MRRNLSDLLKKKDGWATIVIMIAISGILPIFLFFFVEMNYLYGMKDKAQYIADNIANASVRSVSEERLTAGEIEILEAEAVQIANELFKTEYKLNGDLTIGNSSTLRENPILKTYVVNTASEGGERFVTDEGFSIDVYHPSVIIYSSIKPKGVFFNRLVDLKTISVYQVRDNKVVVSEMMTMTNETNEKSETIALLNSSGNYVIPIPDTSHIPNQGNYNGWKRITDSNNRVLYEGNFRNGVFHGYGVLYDVNGKRVYEGAWTNGYYDGFGRVYNPNGTFYYVGDIAMGIPNGYGTHYGSDGKMDYQGEFSNGYREGWGTSYDEDGNSSSGNYTDESNPTEPPTPILTIEELIFEKVYLEGNKRG